MGKQKYSSMGSQSAQTTGLRQQPGFACEYCRRRKARCDRVRPRCGLCAENNVSCRFVDKGPQRGPKKGQIEMMRSRIAMLESELGKQSGSGAHHDADSNILHMTPVSTVPVSGPVPSLTGVEPEMENGMDLHIDMSCLTDTSSTPMRQLTQLNFDWLPTPTETTHATTTASSETGPIFSAEGMEMTIAELEIPHLTSEEQQLTLDDIHPNEAPSSSEVESQISDLMLADLDEIYFERVHQICPMVHQRRYFAPTSQDNPTPAQVCRRSAMRTLAAAMAPPYRNVVNILYTETRQLLEAFQRAGIQEEATGTASYGSSSSHCQSSLENIQALLLMAHYESLRVGERQAMLTAGRAFRLVQMERLYDIDASGAAEEGGRDPGEVFTTTEERRRTFWVAYTLDSFLSWRNEWPLTFVEDMVGTCLPAAEADYQNGEPVGNAVFELETPNALPSLFAECILLAALHNRCVAHRRMSLREVAKGGSGDAFWSRHERLSAAVDRRMKLLLANNPHSAAASRMTVAERDPMMLFIQMLAHSSVISLGETVRRVLALNASSNSKMSTSCSNSRQQLKAYERRATQTASEVARLARALPCLCGVKAHPFLPSLLGATIAFLRSGGQRGGLGGADGQGLQDAEMEALFRLLRELKDVNRLARDICATLDKKQ